MGRTEAADACPSKCTVFSGLKVTFFHSLLVLRLILRCDLYVLKYVNSH